MRIAVLCAEDTLTRWQLDAIGQIRKDNEIFLLDAHVRQPTKRSISKNGFYYVLNAISVRNKLTKKVRRASFGIPLAGKMSFAPAFEGNWALFPQAILRWLKDERIDVIVKFGLGLLRVPSAGDLDVPILSYHHGDPREYRGRPAGFYEIANDEPFMGQVIQVLSNALDAGKIVAFAESRIRKHSYRQTLESAYSLSPHLLPKALELVQQRECLPIDPAGKVYRLPPNHVVFKVSLKLAANKLKRFAYGAFVEKNWRVSRLGLHATADPIAGVQELNARRGAWATIEPTPRYTFYADPFFHGRGGEILVEALCRWTGKGELLRIEDGERRVLGLNKHVSYPSTFEHGERTYVVPETAQWCPLSVFELAGDSAVKIAEVDLAERGILDPTILEQDDGVYLFGNRGEEGPRILRLWTANSLFGQFTEHPASPIRISERGSRMAGMISKWGPQTYRLGQDCRRSYGDGLLAFRIDHLSRTAYRETLIGEAAFEDVVGPHTLNLREGVVLFDWYRERIMPLAGIRRLMARLH